MSIKKIMHKDRHGAQVSIEFGEGGAASNLVEQFLGGMGVPAMQDIPQEHPGDPKGTDTVPAWLTPGEFVMNAEATRMFEPQIEEMNNAGRAVQRQQGGSIPEYKALGGGVNKYDYKRDQWGQIIPGGYELDNLVSPTEDAAIAAAKAGVSLKDIYDLSGVQISMVPNVVPNVAPNVVPNVAPDVAPNVAPNVVPTEEPPVSIDNDYLASLGLGPVPTQEEILRRAVGPSPIDSLYNAPLDVPKPDGPMMKPMGNVTTEQKAERALDRRREAKEAGYPGQQEALEEITTSFKDIYKPKNWQEREALNEEEVVPAIDPYSIEVDVDAINNPKPEEPDENNIDAIFKAASAEQARIDAEAAKKDDPDASPSAWDKVKDFFKEGLGTVLDKGALSEAATLYLGSRALGYDHEGSLNFVTKRYGKGIEDKLAIANKAVGTYTPESITKYKDTGNLMDLALIKTLTYTNETEYWIDPKTGTRYDLRIAEDEKGRKVLVDRDNNAIDTKNLLKADEYNKRLSADASRITPIFESKLAKFELENDMSNGEGKKFLNIPEATQAITQFAMKNNLHTAEMNKLSDYIFQSVIQGKKDLKNKGISDRDLTDLAITDAIVRQMNKDIFVKPDGNRVPATTSDQVLSTLDLLKGKPAVVKGELLKSIYQYGYMARSKKERDVFESKATGGNNGFLEYLNVRGHVVDKDNWIPKYNELGL
jgi:hypothetical protein